MYCRCNTVINIRVLVFSTILILCVVKVSAQSVFHGVLRSRTDSSAIPFASVHFKEANEGVLTDEKGTFKFALPRHTKRVTLEIFAIGIKTLAIYNAPFSKSETIYVDVSSNTLSEFAVKGLSAEEVVRIAVASIPKNYADSSYFDYSFYRRYQKLNGHYVNLFEASPAVMFRINNQAHGLKATEAFAVNELRRSSFHPDVTNRSEDNAALLLLTNPVYHLERSVIDPMRFTSYHFRFDTNNKSNDYIITYRCNSSTDNHGIENFDQSDLTAEAWDSGVLVIERQSFAIKKILRKSMRHRDYVYRFFPPNNWLIYDHKEYYLEFTAGDFEIDYTQRSGKWYLNRIFRQYTNEFYIPTFYTRAFSITDNFEWYSDSVSRFTTAAYKDKFFPVMATAIHRYDTAYWAAAQLPAFHYTDREAIYGDMQRRDGPVEQQFCEETKVDPVKKQHEVRLAGK